MRALDFVHRWLGGLFGLVLALLGLTGTILLHKTAWIGLAHSDDAQRTDVAGIAAATDRIFALAPGEQPQSIIFASENFGLHQVRLSEAAGLYANQDGELVTRWTSLWERPELWLFDLHHHLFSGETGETVAGIAGLAGLFFVVSGVFLWWRTRRTFRLRLLPRRLSRPAILMHHRDLGILVAPLLALTIVTGTMMLFRPFALIVVAPFGPPSAVHAALTPPPLVSGPLAARPDWHAMFAAARARFPDGEFRVLALPRRAGDPIMLRMRREAEWLPNGRTLIAFDAADGRLLFARDALAQPGSAQAFNAAYPLHSAKIGGLPYRLLMTLSGLAMTMLGSLAVWSFWFRRRARPGVRRAESAAAAVRPQA